MLFDKYWTEKFSRHGYSEKETDNTEGDYYETSPDNRELAFVARGETRMTGKVIFWREKEKDGIVIGEIEHENEYNEKTFRTRFYAIGRAYDYFNSLYKNQKESRLKKMLRFGEEKELVSTADKIKINGKDFYARLILSDREFQKILDN